MAPLFYFILFIYLFYKTIYFLFNNKLLSYCNWDQMDPPCQQPWYVLVSPLQVIHKINYSEADHLRFSWDSQILNQMCRILPIARSGLYSGFQSKKGRGQETKQCGVDTPNYRPIPL